LKFNISTETADLESRIAQLDLIIGFLDRDQPTQDFKRIVQAKRHHLALEFSRKAQHLEELEDITTLLSSVRQEVDTQVLLSLLRQRRQRVALQVSSSNNYILQIDQVIDTAIEVHLCLQASLGLGPNQSNQKEP
jgi:hypothetical protein